MGGSVGAGCRPSTLAEIGRNNAAFDGGKQRECRRRSDAVKREWKDEGKRCCSRTSVQTGLVENYHERASATLLLWSLVGRQSGRGVWPIGCAPEPQAFPPPPYVRLPHIQLPFVFMFTFLLLSFTVDRLLFLLRPIVSFTAKDSNTLLLICSS